MPNNSDGEKQWRNAEICRMHEEGIPDADIARLFEITRERVRQIVKRAGLTPRREMIDERMLAIHALWKRGYMNHEIAEAIGQSRHYVANYLHERGMRAHLINREELVRMDNIIDTAHSKGVSVLGLCQGDQIYAARVYRRAKIRGITFDHHRSKEARRQRLIKRIMQ